MPSLDVKTKYPQIDIDPHFRRVIQNFRQTDYLAIGAGTAAFPGAMLAMEQMSPLGIKRMGPLLRFTAFLGACGGFLFAYQSSSLRLWGWKENAREVARAKEQGLNAPGLDVSQSELTPYLQGVAHRNSVYSALKFSTLPWFNFSNHPYHGKGVLDDEGESE